MTHSISFCSLTQLFGNTDLVITFLISLFHIILSASIHLKNIVVHQIYMFKLFVMCHTDNIKRDLTEDYGAALH